MFATEPPCKGLGLYISTSALLNDNEGYPTRLAYIHDDNGIKVGQLLDTLEQQLSAVVHSWLRDVQRHHNELASACWTQISRRGWHKTREIWEFGNVDTNPKVMLFLDGADEYLNELNMERAVYGRFLKPRLHDRVKDWQQAFEAWIKKQNEPTASSRV
jgi:hypothetical protein